MLTKLRQHTKTLSFLLGSLSTIALPPHYLLPIAFLSFSFWLVLLDNAKSKKQAFAFGYWFGFGYFAFGLSWVGNALLIDAMTFGWLYPITIMAAGAFFGLFTAFPALICAYFKNIYAKYFAISATLVLFEWLRSFFLTGFPWNLFGSLLAFDIRNLQLASIIGTYGLSLLVIMMCSAFAFFIKTPSKKSFFISCNISLGLYLLIFGFGQFCFQPHLASSNTKIRIVQPAIPQAMKWNSSTLEDNFQKHISLTQSTGLDEIDFVIWGETATPFALDMDEEHLQAITKAIPQKGYLITGLVRYEFDPYGRYQPLNSMLVINKQGQIEDFYDKSHLVPFGEYIPLKKHLPSWVRPITNVIGNFKAGNGPKKISLPNQPSFGGLICYEVIFPSQILDKSNKPEFIVNITNDGWYGDSAGPHQHLVTTQLRAIEEGLSIVRVANTGISALISPHGEIINSIPLNKSGILDINLPKKMSFSTAYGIFGNLIPLFICLINIFLAIFINRKSTEKSEVRGI